MDRESAFIANQARIGYNAYSQFAHGRSVVTGDPLPTWENLPLNIRDAWKCAAEAIIFKND